MLVPANLNPLQFIVTLFAAIEVPPKLNMFPDKQIVESAFETFPSHAVYSTPPYLQMSQREIPYHMPRQAAYKTSFS